MSYPVYEGNLKCNKYMFIHESLIHITLQVLIQEIRNSKAVLFI